MVSEVAPRTARRRRSIVRIGVAFGIVAAIGTAVAWKAIFARPGEAALRLVPQNVLLVGSVDLSPSPNQALVFKKIDDALARNGLDKHIDGALTDMVAQGPVGEKIRPFAKRGAAFAMLAPDQTTGKTAQLESEDNFVAFFALSDGPAVSKILKTDGKPMFWKGTRYTQLQKEGPGLMVVDDLLVVGMGRALHEVELVSTGTKPSILERQDFAIERSKIDPDSNIMVFMSPEAWAMFGKDAPKEAQGFMGSNKWMAVGLALREEGIALSINGEYDPASATWLKPFSEMAPIRNDLFSALPSGAYGVTALAQPSKYFESFELSVGDNKEAKESMKDFEKSMLKEAGLSLKQDVLPAFQGNAVIGFYPSESGDKAAGADILLMVDDKQGAKAAALAERLREYLEQEIQSDGQETPFEVKVEGDVKRFSLSPHASAEMQDGFAESLGSGGAVKTELMTKDKTITWAQISQTVIASSSAKLLDRAIASYKTQQSSLEQDALWQGKSKSLVDGHQTLMAFNVARIVEGFQNSMDMSKWGEDSKPAQDIMDALKGLNEPLSITSSTGNGKMKMGMFIPLEYDRLIDMIGRNMK